MPENNAKESLGSSMYWVIGLSAIAVGVPLAITLTLLLSSAAIEWLIQAFALRGAILVFFGIGGLIVICALVVPRIQSYDSITLMPFLMCRFPQRINILTIMLILGVAFLITAVAGGIDVTRMMTSPITFARLVGHRTVNALDRRRHRDGRYHARDTIGELAGGIAISYLINLSPFPWNMLIFLSYYKFVTALIFVIIPTVMALWVIVKLWYARKALKEDMNERVEEKDEESQREDENSSSDEDLLFRRRSTDTATVIQGVSKHPRVHRHVHPNFAQTRAERPLIEHHVMHGGNHTYPSV